MISTNLTELIELQKLSIYKESNELSGIIKKIYDLSTAPEVGIGDYEGKVYDIIRTDYDEIFIRDKLGGMVTFPLQESRDYSTYFRHENISYRNRDQYCPIQSLDAYRNALYFDTLPILDLSEFTDEYIFQMRTVVPEYELNSAIFFAVLNYNRTPLFYAPFNHLYTLLNNLLNHGVITHGQC